MKSRYTLLVMVLEDFRDHDLGISLLDIERASRHVDDAHWNEVLLPRLDDALLTGLATGTIGSCDGFSKQRGTNLPRFLHGLWTSVFSADGSLLVDPNVSSMRAIRQISNLHKKVFENCSDDLVSAYVEKFVETDLALSQIGDLDDTLPAMFSKLFGPMLSRIYHRDRVGKHGPGAVAEKYDSVARWDFPNVRQALLDRYGEDFFFASRETYLNRYPTTWDQFGRLVAVPKTATKPRLISIEPAAHQYAQQGLMSILYDELSSYPVTNIRNQSRNQELARLGSIDGSLATLDLSEASDRVSMKLVRHILKNHSWFLDELEDLRTRAVTLPDGRLIPLNKFASMGSALTFPIQVMVFTTIVCAGMGVDRPSEKTLRRPDIGIYGDDIIVPIDYTTTVIASLEGAGLVVNKSKSFYSGLFRESCGADYYRGQDIRPVYVRRRTPLSRHHVNELVSRAKTAWFFHDRHLERSARFLSEEVEKLLGPCAVQASLDGSRGQDLGAITVPFGTQARTRWNQKLQRSEYLLPQSRPVRAPVVATDRATLAAALYAVKGSYKGLRSGVPESDPRVLSHDGRPTSAFISRRWTSLS